MHYFILSILLILLASIILRHFFYSPVVGSMALVNGAVKAGKSTFAVWLCRREYKKIHRRWKIRSFFQNLFNKPVDEEPLFYSNVPLAVPYVPLTPELLTRQERFAYKSVIYVNEASLVADSMNFKDPELNERLQYLNKLIGHETKGGLLFYDTQCISDLHFSIKRCMSEYFFVEKLIKNIPFFLIAQVRVDRYSSANDVVTVNNVDEEPTYRYCLIPKRVWKLFDCYCYSALTDDLQVNNNQVKASSLKSPFVLTLKGYYFGKKTKKGDLKNENEQN